MAPLVDLSAHRHLRWRFAGACFDEASLLLTVDGQAVELERRPLQLLGLLLTHAGEIVTKDEILEALWPGREVSEASVTTCMARLRQGLGEARNSVIRTVHGYGYRFAAPVTVEATSSAPAAAEAEVAFAPGDAVPLRPNWRLVERLGSGGYGDAWLAEQAKSHERRVVKFARDAEGLVALRREVALGRLLAEGLGPRPDLVRILDWNFEAPPPFIETVWAEQGNLADWVARQGGADAVPLATRLDIAAQIAEALAAIHSMAVLHKDLKPANVLMRLAADGRPGIILTDFGSGRALDPARLDAFGITRPEPDQTLPDSSGATQMYRAPETFAGGAPTVQADIFALGVILFQLAAGDLRRPLAAGWEEMIADPLLREDIAAAAAGDPSRRLDDAAELARRLRTLPERTAARARAAAEAAEAARIRRDLELARARRAPLLALLCVLLVALAASTALYVRADRAQVRARRAQADAEMQAARAKAVTGFLTDDLFSAANPLLAADPNVSVRRVLAASVGDLGQRFAAGSLDRAAIEAAMGGAYAGLADPDHALPLLRSALAARRAQLGDSAPETQAVRLAMMDLAERTLDNEGMRAAAVAVLAAHPADAGTELRARYGVLSADCARNGTDASCIARLRPFLAEARRRLGERDPLTLKAQSFLAFELSDSQQFQEAIPLARETVALTAQVYGPDHLLVQDRRFQLGEVLVEAGQTDEAIAVLTDVRKRLLELSGGETEVSARAAAQLGHALVVAKRYDEALALLHSALDYDLRTRGEMFVASRNLYNDIANALAFMGREKEAIAIGEKALDLQRRADGDNHRDTLWLENNLADFYHRDGDLAHAEALYRDLVARGRKVFVNGEWDLGHFEFHLGEVLAQEGKLDEARVLLVESVGILTKSLGPDDRHTVRARAVLASLPVGGEPHKR
jgi:non-specific serine/threonine protein kinase